MRWRGKSQSTNVATWQEPFPFRSRFNGQLTLAEELPCRRLSHKVGEGHSRSRLCWLRLLCILERSFTEVGTHQVGSRHHASNVPQAPSNRR